MDSTTLLIIIVIILMLGAAVGTAADVGINLGMGFWWLRVPCCRLKKEGAQCHHMHPTWLRSPLRFDTVREPLLVLDNGSGAVRSTSHLKSPRTRPKTDCSTRWAIANGISRPSERLETIVPEPDVMDAYEVDRELARYRGS